mgnify:CR=1 FL=1
MDDINQIIANLTPQDMEMLRGVAASILGDGGQGSAPGAASPPGAQPTPQPKPGSANSAVQQLTDTVAGAQNMQNLLSGLEGLNFGKADFEMMMKAKSIFDRMNRSSNKKCGSDPSAEAPFKSQEPKQGGPGHADPASV